MCRYLQPGFEDSIAKMLKLLNRFSASESNKLAMCLAYFFIAQIAPMSVLSTLFLEHLVKDGHSLQFITAVFKTYLSEQPLDLLSGSLKKHGLDDKVPNLSSQNSQKKKEVMTFFNPFQYI